MRIISWNVKRATEASAVWKILTDLNPDIALLQEVSSIPQDIKELFDIKFRMAVTKSGNPQRFGTAVFVQGKIIDELPLSSEYDWVNRELERFAGNIMAYVVKPTGYPTLKVVSVHSPAWPIDTSGYQNIDITTIKLKQNPKLWVTEILWSALKNVNLIDTPWIVGGDFNSSETFDLTFSSGNREIQGRMQVLGFTECLRKSQGKLTSTFRNASDGKIIHQMDHLFVTDSLSSKLQNCDTGEKLEIFEKSISDHLPIIADFKIMNDKVFEEQLSNQKWIFAKTYAKTAPHEYFLKVQNEDLFLELKRRISELGIDEKFYESTFRYYYHGDFKYWAYDELVNRDRKDSKYK